MREFRDIVTSSAIPFGSTGNASRNEFVQMFMHNKLSGAARHFWLKKVTDKLYYNDRLFTVTDAYVQHPYNSIFNLHEPIRTMSHSITRRADKMVYTINLDPATVDHLNYLLYQTDVFSDREKVFVPFLLDEDRSIVVKLADCSTFGGGVEVLYDIEEWMLCQVTGERDRTRRIVIEEALRIVNDSFGTPDDLMNLFGHNDYGWKVPVVLDYDRDLQSRRALWEDHYRPDEIPLFIDENGQIPYEPIDILGEYHPVPGYIKLYVNAIDGFISEISCIGATQPEPKHIYAYILAHELFHAYQDFHVSLKDEICGQNVEISAEYFALRYVKNILHDYDLYAMLCDERRNHPLRYYSDALTQYGGDIDSPGSQRAFLDYVDLWI